MNASDDNEAVGGEVPAPEPPANGADAPTAEMPAAEPVGAETHATEPGAAAAEAAPAARRSITIQAPRRTTVLVAAGVAAAFLVGAVAGREIGDGGDERRACVRAAPWLDCGPAWFDGKGPPAFGQRGPQGFGDPERFRDRNERHGFNG